MNKFVDYSLLFKLIAVYQLEPCVILLYAFVVSSQSPSFLGGDTDGDTDMGNFINNKYYFS